uniref:PUB domain-containing protein n=1 Tax=Ditylum brightwellii TaxID=49249 RepID=A0A7S1ZPL7_9STRA|mmetsp:Transcript_36277/g.54102  ORF Transcript_36277/g.54102 Transcript_36277/m.54102 type:complete len:119 (+) Transcript_36277:921-1277(+)
MAALSKALQILSFTTTTNTNNKAGINMLYLYLRNLSNHPTVPRYRKIYTNNATYSKNVVLLDGGKELLKSVGFEEFASVLEWNDGEDDDGEEGGENRLALVKDAVAALELLKYGKKKD